MEEEASLDIWISATPRGAAPLAAQHAEGAAIHGGGAGLAPPGGAPLAAQQVGEAAIHGGGAGLAPRGMAKRSSGAHFNLLGVEAVKKAAADREEEEEEEED